MPTLLLTPYATAGSGARISTYRLHLRSVLRGGCCQLTCRPSRPFLPQPPRHDPINGSFVLPRGATRPSIRTHYTPHPPCKDHDALDRQPPCSCLSRRLPSVRVGRTVRAAAASPVSARTVSADPARRRRSRTASPRQAVGRDPCCPATSSPPAAQQSHEAGRVRHSTVQSRLSLLTRGHFCVKDGYKVIGHGFSSRWLW